MNTDTLSEETREILALVDRETRKEKRVSALQITLIAVLSVLTFLLLGVNLFLLLVVM